MKFPRLASARTSLLSAGPGAGKTALLSAWREESTTPTLYLALSREDQDFRFFAYRLLLNWPSARARHTALEDDVLAASPGVRLARAIAETHPDACLLLDDFHRLEGAEALPEVMAFLRYFPDTGTLAIASRHQLPALDRPSIIRYEAAEPFWSEKPSFDDVLALPDELFAQVLALAAVGEVAPSSAGFELVRRNVACLSENSTLHLRAPWRSAAELVLKQPNAEQAWEAVEAQVAIFQARHLRTVREAEIPEILDRIPAARRSVRPLLLHLEGDHHLEMGQLEQAKGCYRRALSLTAGKGGLATDMRLRLARLASIEEDVPLLRDLLAAFEAGAIPLCALQEAELLQQQALLHWFDGRKDCTEPALKQVLGLPIAGDRLMAYEHFRALRNLHTLCYNQYRQREAFRYAEQMLAIAQEHGFHADLLRAHLAWLDTRAQDETEPQPFMSVVAIPPETFEGVAIEILLCYLWSLAVNAQLLYQHELALRLYRYYQACAIAKHMPIHVHMSGLGLLNNLARLGRLENAALVYDELSRVPAFGNSGLSVQRRWAMILSAQGRREEAEALLAGLLDGEVSEQEKTFTRLTLLGLKARHGDAAAEAEARAFLAAPEGRWLAKQEALFLSELGLVDPVPCFQLRVFGAITFQQGMTPIARWPRKKALALLALLVLHPDGCTTEELAQALFGDPGAVESLHTTVYTLRQSLKVVGGADLIESARGIYRLDQERIAFCDLYAFDALYGNAQALEGKGQAGMGAMFYELALMFYQGPLFDDLPEDFDVVREAYQAKVRHAQAFLKANRSVVSLARLPSELSRSL
ncbi:hypothetical protein J7643_01010 [bacterium]|nr:hypothetical protein [bacterium]